MTTKLEYQESVADIEIEQKKIDFLSLFPIEQYHELENEQSKLRNLILLLEDKKKRILKQNPQDAELYGYVNENRNFAELVSSLKGRKK